MASRSVVKGLPTRITSATFSDLPTTFLSLVAYLKALFLLLVIFGPSPLPSADVLPRGPLEASIMRVTE